MGGNLVKICICELLKKNRTPEPKIGGVAWHSILTDLFIMNAWDARGR
jgi:hypothetical protein